MFVLTTTDSDRWNATERKYTQMYVVYSVSSQIYVCRELQY